MLLSRYDSEEFFIQVGCDEAGRGCLAGSVIAAAVILPLEYSNPRINDSKLLNASIRYQLRDDIIQNAVSYGIGEATHVEIDKINILQATFLAMHRAIDQLSINFDILLIDGNRFKPYKNITHKCFIKGDGTYQSIAAAAILAKTYRDDQMKIYDKEYPQYQFSKNKGYASRQHIEAIEKYGYTPIHRKTFKLKKLSGQLFLFNNDQSPKLN